MANCDTISYKDTMIIQQPDTEKSYKHLMWSRNITGGQVYGYLSKTMSKDVEHVNNSR